MSALTRRVEKLENEYAVGQDEYWEFIVLNDGDPEPIIDDERNVIIVRGVKPRNRQEA